MGRGYIYSILSAIMFGSAGIFIKMSYNAGLDSVDILIVQYMIAVSIMFSLLFVNGRKKLKISRHQMLDLAILGIVGNTFMTVFYYVAFKYLSVAMVTMLLFTYPVMIFIYSVLFEKNKITASKTMAVILCFVGCVLGLNIFRGSMEYTFKGVLFGLLSAVFYAFMNLYSEKKLKNVDSMAINAYSTLFSLISLVIYKPPYFLVDGSFNLGGIPYIILLAIFSEIIPLTLFYSSICYIGAVKTSIIGNLEIPTAVLLSYLILGEKIYFLQLVGIILIIFAVYIVKNRK